MNTYNLASARLPLPKNHTMPTLTVSRLAFGLVLALSAGTASAQNRAAGGPNPQMEPPQVVEAMLAALKKNTSQGIAELYKFSSPGNRERTGPVESFSKIIREGFPDMLGHRAARVAPPLIDGDRAMLPVEIQGSDNELHRYVFMLSRQSIPECNGCWMADAVFSPEQGDPNAPEGPGGEEMEAPREYGA